MKKKRISVIITLLLLAFAFRLTGCDNSSDYFGDGNLNYNDEDPAPGEDDDSSDPTGTVSLADKTMTEEFAREVYAVMQEYAFREYFDITNEQWQKYGDDEKLQVFEDISAMLTKLGFAVNADKTAWLEAMDENAESDGYTVWYAAFNEVGFNESEALVRIYHYVQGVEAAEYQPLAPEILAAADDITVEYWEGQYLLCAGGNHAIVQVTKKWTTEESDFYISGSVQPIEDGGIFDSVSYSLGGENGKFQYADFGEADLLPVFKALGTIAEDGSMKQEQIQISAKSTFDAARLFVLSQDENGFIRFAIIEYSEEEGKYIWDGELLTANGRCCFNKDGNFCYIDESGTFRELSS